MSGSDTEMKLPSSAVLFLILWKIYIDDFERFVSLFLHCCCGLRDHQRRLVRLDRVDKV